MKPIPRRYSKQKRIDELVRETESYRMSESHDRYQIDALRKENTELRRRFQDLQYHSQNLQRDVMNLETTVRVPLPPAR